MCSKVLKWFSLSHTIIRSAATLYFFKSIILFLRKITFYTFSGVNIFYTFFLPKMVNLVIEDSSDFTFRDLMSLRG